MKLLNFYNALTGELQLGVKTNTGILDVKAAAKRLAAGKAPDSLEAFIKGGSAWDSPEEARLQLEHLVMQAAQQPDKGWWLDEAELRYGPCVANPEKIICVGLNYRRHAQESGAAVPKVPVLFSKFSNTIAAYGEIVPLPEGALEYDYEVELGVIIGKEARSIPLEKALEVVLGYATFNDLSARDLQMRTSQWLLGKTSDKFLPVGPYLVTADEVGDPQNLALRCWVNGELRQNSNTADMVFSVAEIIHYVSQYMTLKPGDLISTGTPEGVILGMKEKVWLKPGDEVAVDVEKLGRLVNVMGRYPASS